MQPYPHHYRVTASAKAQGEVTLGAEGLTDLLSAPPPEFGGPGDRWSPETLFVAAAADCLILSFRAIATASKLPWQALECRAEGTLDRVEGRTRFVALHLHAELTLPADGNVERARRLLEKAEVSCLVTSSLKFEPELSMNVSLA